MFSGAHRLTPIGDDVDFYPTQPWAARAGAEIILRLDPRPGRVCEPACGGLHMVHGLTDILGPVMASDACLYDRNVVHDFLSDDPSPFGEVDWIVTNPPFSALAAFVRQALKLARRGVALLMPARALEGVERHQLMFGDATLTVFAPFSERLPMHRGMYDPDRSTAAFYAWFVWLKPVLRPARFMARAPVLGGDRRPCGTSRPDAAWRLRPAVWDIPPGTRKRLFRRSDLAFAVGGAARSAAARLTAQGTPLTPADLSLLAKITAANGERGVTSARGVFDAGRLATLKAMDLLEHAPPLKGDDGERRFRPSPDGRAVLAEWEGEA
jgi:hypothetical protein